jgi:hypothetical protein
MGTEPRQLAVEQAFLQGPKADSPKIAQKNQILISNF